MSPTPPPPGRGSALSDRADDDEFTGLLATRDFPFKIYEDLKRVLDIGLQAGVRICPTVSMPSRRTGCQRGDQGVDLRPRLRGHNVATGDAYSRTTAADGLFSLTAGALSLTGISRIEGDQICNALTNGRSCRAVLRNPKGTFDQKNEYLLFGPADRFEFSVVK